MYRIMKMKKALALILSMALLTSCLTACDKSAPKENSTKKAPAYSLNEEYSLDSMVTVKGETVSLEEEAEAYTTDKEKGYAFRVPQSWHEIDGLNPVDVDEYSIEIDYIPVAGMNKYYEAMDDEGNVDDAIITEVLGMSVPMLGIYRYDDEAADKDKLNSSFEAFKEMFANVEELGSVENSTFYFLYNDKIDRTDMDEQDNEWLDSIIADYNAVRDSLCLFPPITPKEEFKADLSSFTCEDLDGNAIDETFFSNYDVTMINCWTTWCGYCIEEMPEIGRLKDILPDNYNVVTICFDADTQGDLAKELLEQAGARNVTTFVVNDILEEIVGSQLIGFPTTFFVDKNGHVIGSLEIGAPTSDGSLAEAYLELIKKAASEIE